MLTNAIFKIYTSNPFWNLSMSTINNRQLSHSFANYRSYPTLFIKKPAPIQKRKNRRRSGNPVENGDNNHSVGELSMDGLLLTISSEPNSHRKWNMGIPPLNMSYKSANPSPHFSSDSLTKDTAFPSNALKKRPIWASILVFVMIHLSSYWTPTGYVLIS